MTDQEIARGEHARQLLNDPLFIEAFDTIERECFEQWQATPARDTDGRERIWMMIKLSARLKDHFKAIVDHGKIASAEIADIEKNKTIRDRIALMIGS